MAFDTEIQALTGTATQSEMDQWMADGAKEIINILPPKLKEKCVSATGVGTDFKVDLDGLGEILYVTRENADSGFLVPCRKIPSMYGGLAFSGSGHMMYEPSITDPVYWVDGDTSGAATLYVKPTPTANQPAIVHHVAYPTIDASAVSTIANFPDEAEYLVVLYAAIKVLQNKMNDMQSVTAIDTTVFTLIKAAVDQAETAANKFESATESVFGDEDTFDTAASQLTRVKDALNNAEKIIDDGANSPTGDAAGDAATYLFTEEDTELVQGALGIAASEIKRAQMHLSEWTGIGDMRVKEVQAALAEATGYVSEAKIRMEREFQKYGWYQGQYTALKQDYQQGIQMLLGPPKAQPGGGK